MLTHTHTHSYTHTHTHTHSYTHTPTHTHTRTSKVEILSPPPGTPVGERLCFGTFAPAEALPAPDGPNKIQKKKVWETLQADLRTDGEGGAAWKDLAMVSSAGQVACGTLTNSNIS